MKMRKYSKPRPKPVVEKTEKAESKLPSLSDNLPQTPRERRDSRRKTALAEAEKAVALRMKKD